MRLVNGLVDIHLLALVLQSGSGNLPTEDRVRLGAHPVLILRLIIVIGLAHLLLRPLFLTPHVFEVLEFLLVVLNELHAVPIPLSHFLNFQRIRLNVIQNYGLDSRVILLHQILVF